MKRSVLAFKNYEVHSITTVWESEINANIATWVMQSGMKAKELTVALYRPDYTIELVRKSGVLNVNLLSVAQKSLIARLGRKSGKTYDKFNRLPHGFDKRGCPFLTDSIGYIMCEVTNQMQGIDHDLFACKIIGQKVLNPDQKVLTHRFLKDNGYIR